MNASVNNIPVPDNAPTRIRNYTGKRRTAQYLAALLGIPEERIETGSGDGLTSNDIMVIAGPDMQLLLTGQPTPTPAP